MMFRLMATIALACGTIPFVDSVANADDPPKLTAEQNEFFESKIRPILADHCYQCHSASSGEDLEGGLLLDSRWGWSTGGDSGPAIVPGDVDESLLIHAVRYQEDLVSAMPPKSKLPEKKIKLLEKWVTMGAPDPRAKVESADKAMVEPFDIKKRFNEHWSWRPIRNPQPPTINNTDWPKNDIDRFVLSKLESAGITPAEPADKETWIRRVYFDLIGLPPTPDQVDAYVQDTSDGAMAKVVDGLLQSVHFGEKWARHWMDLVRYAETYGHEFDYPLEQATAYRDYLIRAFNQDVPYDQFVREHIAGDLIKNPRKHPTEQYNESVIGTGFWYLHEATHAPTDVLQNEADIIDNQLDVLSKSFLGLTVACARCHDHKFDAISAADYYALSAYIQSSCRQMYPLDPGKKIESAVRQLTDLQPKYAASLRSKSKIDSSKLDPAKYFVAAREAIHAAVKQSDGAKKDESTKKPKGKKKQKADKKTLAAVSDDAISETAKKHDVDRDRLAKWIQRLTSVTPSVRLNNPWEMLSAQINDEKAQEKLQNTYKRELNAVHGADKTLERMVDFQGSQLPDGWTTSGHAFRSVGETPKFIPIGTNQPKPGTVDSAVFGNRVAGILRSPTFTITKSKIHVRMRATKNIRMRIIVDNYQMARFNALLFRGMDLAGDATNTNGTWQWKTLQGNLDKYIGHKAYLEFTDGGDESIAIDQIWFSNGGTPRIFDESIGSFVSPESLSESWKIAVEDFQSGEQNDFLDWLISNGLIAISELAPQVKAVADQANEIAVKIPHPRMVIAMTQGTNENAHVYVRGNPEMLGLEVPPRTLESLGGHNGNRMELANRIASLENPLAARVMTNRIWHHLFGRGIVPSVDDFGPQGIAPSHPDLLDFVATDFVKDGWSIKKAIRKMVLSQTYGQSSIANKNNDSAILATADPTNTLLHRMRVRRLPAESIRDAILLVSGRLDPIPRPGSVATHRTPFMTGRGARESGPLDGAGRRSVYLSVYRNFLNSFMMTFDMPSPFGPQGRRSSSNVPAQALALMNDPFVIQQAGLWADRILKDAGGSERERIAAMVRSAHSVSASDATLDRLQKFLDDHEAKGKDDKQAWTDLAHALINMKSFYFLK